MYALKLVRELITLVCLRRLRRSSAVTVFNLVVYRWLKHCNLVLKIMELDFVLAENFKLVRTYCNFGLSLLHFSS